MRLRVRLPGWLSGPFRGVVRRVGGLGLRVKLLGLIGLMIVLMAVIGLNDLRIIARIVRDGNRAYEQSLDNVQHALSAKAAFSSIAAAVDEHLAATSPAEFSEAEAAIAEDRKVLEESLKRIRTNEERAGILVRGIRGNLEVFEGVVTQLLALSKTGRKEEARWIAASDLRSLRLAASSNLDNLARLSRLEAAGVAQANERAAAEQRRVSLLVLLVAALASVALGVSASGSLARAMHQVGKAAERLAAGDLTHTIPVSGEDELGHMAAALNRGLQNLRDLVAKVAEASERVAGSSRELAASAEAVGHVTQQVSETIGQFALGAETQAQAAQETEGIAAEMSSSLEEIASSAEQLAQDAHAAADTARRGREAVAQTFVQMNAIKETVALSAQAVRGLGDRSRQIGSISEMITTLADQTNLLALNAAIEAARAGEQGRGFSVVADEVRKLAEQSRVAAERISALIGDIQRETGGALEAIASGTQAVDEGTQVVARAGEAFAAIAGAVEQMVGQIERISGATEQQADNGEKLFKSIEAIASITQESAAGVNEISAGSGKQAAAVAAIGESARSLAALAQELREALTNFRL